MIALHQLPRLWGIPNISHAATKLETWLRMCSIDYALAPFVLADAPKGKVPYIKDENGFRGDSTLIIGYLKKRYERDPDAWLSRPDYAISLAFRRMMKENLYWASMYDRYVNDDNWHGGYKQIVI